MEKFRKLWEIIETLRDPVDGCPWDREQTAKSLIPNFIEELYEAIEAIENNDMENLKEELGDLMLHILMQIRIAKEQGKMTIDDVLDRINNKLIRRHPHIFAKEEENGVDTNSTPAEIIENWEKIKHKEKKESKKSILSGIPKSMPALIYAQRMQEKAASTGFDWDKAEEIIPKIEEEFEELKQAIDSRNIAHEMEEAGDLLFSIVNYCRKRGFDSEIALKKASEKFRERFEAIEAYHYENNKNIFNSSVEELNELWEQTKTRPRTL